MSAWSEAVWIVKQLEKIIIAEKDFDTLLGEYQELQTTVSSLQNRPITIVVNSIEDIDSDYNNDGTICFILTESEDTDLNESSEEEENTEEAGENNG